MTLALLLESETANPPAAAAEFNETLHEVLPGALIVVVVQLNPLRDAVGLGSVMTPDPPVAGIDAPSPVAATTFVS